MSINVSPTTTSTPKPLTTLKKTFVIGISALLITGLSACGGGGGGDSEGRDSQPVKPSTPKPTQPKPSEPEPTKPEPTKPEPTKPKPPTSDFTLPDTATLPALIPDTNPIKFQPSIEGIEDLKSGVYSIIEATLIFSDGQYDCSHSISGTTCLAVTRYQLDEKSNELNIDTWLYEPVKQKWSPITLQESDTPFIETALQSDGKLTSNGEHWLDYYDNFDLRFTNFYSEPAQLTYQAGETKIGLTAIPVDYSNKTIAYDDESMTSFRAGAKRYDFVMKLQNGQYLSLEESEPWVEYDVMDNISPYFSLSDYRQQHASTDNPICFSSYKESTALVFNANNLGANLFDAQNSCKNLTVVGSPILVEEGVATIEDQQVIYLSNPVQLDAQQSTSEQQYLWAIFLNFEGVPYQGKAYQSGYAEKHSPDYFNKVALLDRIKSLSQDQKALNTPF